MVVATGMAPRLSRLSIVQMESVKAVKRHSGRTQTVRFYERNWIGLEGKKENNKRILLIITFTLLLFWALMHTDTVLGIVGTILAVLAPFLLRTLFCICDQCIAASHRKSVEYTWSELGGGLGKKAAPPGLPAAEHPPHCGDCFCAAVHGGTGTQAHGGLHRGPVPGLYGPD